MTWGHTLDLVVDKVSEDKAAIQWTMVVNTTGSESRSTFICGSRSRRVDPLSTPFCPALAARLLSVSISTYTNRNLRYTYISAIAYESNGGILRAVRYIHIQEWHPKRKRISSGPKSTEGYVCALTDKLTSYFSIKAHFQVQVS